MKSECEFLHDMLNHLTTANGQIELTLLGMGQAQSQNSFPTHAEACVRLKKAKKALDSLATAIGDRRELLHRFQEEEV